MPLPMPGMTEPAAAPTSVPNAGYTIAISVLPDGTFAVSNQPLEQEAAEETGAPGSEVGQTLKTFGDALKAALDIYKNDGKGGDEQSDFMSGFAPPAAPTETVQ